MVTGERRIVLNEEDNHVAVRSQIAEHNFIKQMETKNGRPIPMEMAKSIRMYLTNAHFLILISRDDTVNGLLWHISVSNIGNTEIVPSWQIMKEIKYAFFPKMDMMQVFPNEENFFSLPDCNALHLYEMPFEWKNMGEI